MTLGNQRGGVMMQRCSLSSCGSVHEADGSPHPSNLALALDAGDTKDDDVHPSSHGRMMMFILRLCWVSEAGLSKLSIDTLVLALVAGDTKDDDVHPSSHGRMMMFILRSFRFTRAGLCEFRNGPPAHALDA
jgi:hypothetical protein